MIVAIDGFSRPGWILIAGGGYKKNGLASWSTHAYTWAASGHKVAIIGASSQEVIYIISLSSAEQLMPANWISPAATAPTFEPKT